MPNATKQIHVVGAGLAGSECALQLAEKLGPSGYKIVLHEMRGSSGGVTTPAHRSNDCAELVCSNSFGSLAAHAAPGLLKWEAETLGSKILESALDARVPAGQALGMDREKFASLVTSRVAAHPHIEIRRELITSLDAVPRPAVIATGPLTHESLAQSIREHFTSNDSASEFLYFFDAIAPIVAADSINSKIAWKADRWDRGTKDYWNCPMTKKEYYFFIDAIRDAKKIEPKEFEKDTPFFESCMPIEAILARGPMTLRFGPMSPKGLPDPRTGNNPFAVVQLRQDNAEGTAYNMVGFQTKMAYGDQKSVFRLIPGLEEAEFLKLGSIHRNLYLNTPKLLNADLSSKKDPWLFFAGQITGVEGYFESTCMGWLVAHLLTTKLRGESIESALPPRESALGSLHRAITDETKIAHFQPTNINFGHMPEPPGFEWAAAQAVGRKVDKVQKKEEQIRLAKLAMGEWARDRGIARPAVRVESAAQALLALAEPAATETTAAP
ncbi:MAG: methylenetetrahydrofolate--tRNA-(uracil(54)-C(5))-methyltransferase (FADH(2)-oxidizing) TrmFO [Bdellovibrionales bacterium]|nr:methylenetetrahydrofolate--tRNA-(uracil(54)-C(5))-methyltransferase (FADH(2)-oxidizing) TrmFO [Bdellovibrionales bacterium]